MGVPTPLPKFQGRYKSLWRSEQKKSNFGSLSPADARVLQIWCALCWTSADFFEVRASQGDLFFETSPRSESSFELNGF